MRFSFALVTYRNNNSVSMFAGLALPSPSRASLGERGGLPAPLVGMYTHISVWCRRAPFKK